jgi:hypothetical protein
MFFMLAQVVDDPWGPLHLPKGSTATDWAWVTREEAIQEYCKSARMGELLRNMLSL